MQIGFGIDLLHLTIEKRLDRLRHRFTDRFFCFYAILNQYTSRFSTQNNLGNFDN